jgi:hypothetical protein
VKQISPKDPVEALADLFAKQNRGVSKEEQADRLAKLKKITAGIRARRARSESQAIRVPSFRGSHRFLAIESGRA